MRAHRILLPLLAVLAALGFFTMPLAAGDVRHSNSYSVLADYSIDDGCIVTYVIFSISSGVVHQPPAAPRESTLGNFVVWQHDFCRQVTRLNGSTEAELEEGALVVDRKLDFAILQLRLPVFETTTQQTVFLDIDLRWTPTEPATHSNYRYRSLIAGTRLDSRSIGLNRPAQITGSVAVNGIELTSGHVGGGNLSYGRLHMVIQQH
ncbi:MAG TPA: hypothetical protein VLE27_05895 [Thermoanaerobaculia bacterium]|nr:hypothetical protein [Thermoanaerobaculia bacterium]